jgi:zinc D-Ala-D-Ala carboxypeptidase
MGRDYFPEGFACPHCGMDKFDPAMRHILNLGREQFGRPLILNSACRCEAHNIAVGGARKSAHLIGPDGLCHAADIRCYSDITRATLHEIFSHLGIRRFEVSDQHLHIDNAVWLPTPLLKAVTFAVVPEG